jgi:Zn finger protein HypA/HybF involved in hydrogenase expression
MSSGEIITRSLVKAPQAIVKYEIDLIHENTDAEGNIICHSCESGYLDSYEKLIRVSVGFSTSFEYKLHSYFCDNCHYYHIDDDDTANTRKLNAR